MFWLDHDRVALPPGGMLVELAEKLTVGVPSDEGGGLVGTLLLVDTETEAERVMVPPEPVQVSR